ncbi:aKG-HExxH-type peptide beta-hydroxylase [Roseateles oligotrophus]|uniref:HEXXH motif-containing putative peptide modification protein n=1 Tax=Roseateles oligotrophus TaxID=1769250 RepID=A0ABT2YMR6_9BURK|nr:HEXXH motif-containing putative peptide modification protein [Roseateles oligotrophus]MCV2371357.1 HEXXH motif-containing putative peptide modification protein [Roseateles oligotrophus]
MSFPFGVPTLQDSPSLRVEVLADAVLGGFVGRGLDLLSPQEASTLEVRRVLDGASELIRLSPTLSSTVHTVAKSIHLLRQDDPSIDVSFSDPEIPFSIFVSVCPNANLASYRLAEAIIHEAMHLQLTLIEKTVPLLKDGSATFYSPWKQTERPASGLLHALYVFGVINEWLELLVEAGLGEHYAVERRAAIASEIELVDAMSLKYELSFDGLRLMERLVRQR